MERREVDKSLTLSALQMGLLRSYNPFAPPGTQTPSYPPYKCNGKIDSLKTNQILSTIDFSPILGAFQPYPTTNYPNDALLECKSRRNLVTPLLVGGGSFCHRRSRGEKKAIPDEQKDDRYFERRKRNNQAAKKSRDARKLREDQIALRAAILEHENAMMRAQILTLREETQALRGMLLLNKKGDRDAAVQLPLRINPYLSSHALVDSTVKE